MDSGCYTDGSGVGFYPTKINSALTSAFPKAIDIESDIIKQGLVDTYLRELKSALRTRGLMDVIEQREPSIEEIISANRGISTNDAQNIQCSTTCCQEVAPLQRVGTHVSEKGCGPFGSKSL